MNPLQLERVDYSIGQIQYAVSRKLELHWHSDHIPRTAYCIAYVYSGTAKYICSGRSFTVEKGNVLFLRRGEHTSASNIGSEPWSCISVGFDLSFGDQESKALFDKFSTITIPKVFTDYAFYFSELYRHYSGMRLNSLVKCRNLITDILYIDSAL